MAEEQAKTPEMENGQPESPLETQADENSGKQKNNKKEKHSKRKSADDNAKIAALEQQVADARQQMADVQNQLLRTAAEYDNYRKRSQKEHDTAFNNGVGYAVLELLPVLDTLEAAAKADTQDEEYKKGVLMILTKSEEVFKKLGVTEIDALNQPFDPELHNAVMQHACEGAECGTVTQVIQKGYMLNGKVVRHAMVGVAP